jgi:beta-mannosidase
MLSSLDLNGTWKIRGFDGQHGRPEQYVGDDADERTFIDAHVPGEIHLDLERAGLIQDIQVGLNAQAARWVEEQVWLYRTKFDAPKGALSQHAWLVFEGLDLNAVVYLNGEQIGTHDNAFVPCRLDVTGKLREGVNTLAVRIESGLFSVAEKQAAGYSGMGIENALTKRAWLRKPQYSFSWDWAPRLINVGIWQPVRLEWTDTARIDAVTVRPELAEDHKTARIHARVFIDSVLPEPGKATIRMHAAHSPTLPLVHSPSEQEIELAPGLSQHDLSVQVEDPKLWWPRPHGEQPLYDVRVEIEIAGKVIDSASRRTGIRSIRINRDPHPVEGEYFILEVNGRPIFAKGGNWVPPDGIYARPDEQHYRRLVRLAVDANFNALRVWGGGVYADHRFLDACDEMGVMVWHDFIFACAKYPGDDPDFLNNVRREIAFVARDLSHHPSLLVWCGNNELEWAAWEWGYDRIKSYPDYCIYHLEMPRILAREDPSRPYWPSSPYSPDHTNPKSPIVGDQHPWHVSLGAGGPDFWEYRNDVSRFPNEGGVLGASCPATLRQFLPEDQRRLFSPAWEFHDNACNYWVQPPLTYRSFEFWLGRKPEEVTFEDYAFYSGILQSEGLQEYANNYRRRMFSSSSAIFWMYNDSWPATHGWTIVDYYLRRKLAYHPVRRAFAPVHVIPAIEGEEVVIFGVNDTPKARSGQVRWGIFRLAGGLPVDRTADVALPPNASTVLGRMPLAEWESIGTADSGAFTVLLEDGRPVAQNRLFVTRFKDLRFAEPDIKVERRGSKAVFSSPTFVWAVTLDWDGESPIADDVFDLLPGIEYEIAWPEDVELPKAQRSASPLLRTT